MFGDMMKKLQEAQGAVEEAKKRMDTVFVDEQSADGNIKVSVRASRIIKSLSINPEFAKNADTEELEDYLILTLNKALAKAESVYDAEMAAVTKQNMPNIPGL